MTVICSGWMRRENIVVHDPKCPVNIVDGSGEVSHGISAECLKLYRISNGLPAEKEEEPE